MKHLFLSDSQLGAKELILADENFHYLKNVRRLKSGCKLTGVDSRGNIYNLQITGELPGKFILEYRLKESGEKKVLEKIPYITLYQGILKGNKFDAVIRQATEAGIDRIVPLVSEYTIVKIKENSEYQKNERWKRIAREAVQQSGRISIPEITAPGILQKLKELEGLKLFFHQEPVSPKTLHSYLAECPGKIHVLIGPEGGFSQKEITWLDNNGFLPVYMGANILRAETAAIFAIAAIKMILLEKNEWRLI